MIQLLFLLSDETGCTAPQLLLLHSSTAPILFLSAAPFSPYHLSSQERPACRRPGRGGGPSCHDADQLTISRTMCIYVLYIYIYIYA